MTEAEWLAATDLQTMLRAVLGKISARKSRLFGVGSCRRVWELLDQDARNALAVVERFADGLATDADRSEARKVAQRSAQPRGTTSRPTAPKSQRRAASAVYYAASRDADQASAACQLSVEALVWRFGDDANCDWQALSPAEYVSEAQLLRCVVGNPFRPVTFDSSWLTSTVVSLAEGIYADRAFDRLPILADALQDAGCDSADVLGHCRGPGPHARGCWVIDLLLGKS
jgi:hypothetical protein